MSRKLIQESEIMSFLKTHYGIKAYAAQLLALGADMSASAYKADSISHSYFVKIKHDNHEEIHMEIIRLLHDAGIKAILLPIATMDGKLLKRLDQFKMIVYPFIDGNNGFEKELTKNQWIALGKAFKKIHALTLPLSISQQLRKEFFSPKWRQMVKSLYAQVEPNTADDEITSDFKCFFKSNFNAIQKLVNSADNLFEQIQYHSINLVLCHSDIHAGNVLINADESFYIIDWDDPIMAPKERDLMFIGGGVGNVWNLPTEIAYFYEGYGEVDINRTILSYYRHERIIEDIALFGEHILAYNENDQSKLINFNYFKSMFMPKGVVDIAFNIE